MTGTQLAALVHYKTKSNSTTFTLANMLVLVNVFKNEIASLITEVNQGYFAVPAKDDLVADQREYPLATDLLNHLIKVECKFASGNSRFPLIAVKDYKGSETESEIVSRYANQEGSAFYYIRRRSIIILSGTIVSVTDALRQWYIQQPQDLTDLTGSTDLSVDPSNKEAGFPKQFHELLARRVGMERKSRNNQQMSSLELNYQNDLRKQLDALSPIDLSLEIIADETPTNHGFDH